jgi:hypothetical protein
LDFATSHQPNGQVFCDLEGLRSAENPPSTIPPGILSTSAHPDIAIVSTGCTTLVELTVPWDSEDSLSRAKCRKNEKENYQLALADLTSLEINDTLVTIEIGCLGHHRPDLFSAIKNIAPCSTPSERTDLRDKQAQSLIASSHVIF